MIESDTHNNWGNGRTFWFWVNLILIWPLELVLEKQFPGPITIKLGTRHMTGITGNNMILDYILMVRSWCTISGKTGNCVHQNPCN